MYRVSDIARHCELRNETIAAPKQDAAYLTYEVWHKDARVAVSCRCVVPLCCACCLKALHTPKHARAHTQIVAGPMQTLFPSQEGMPYFKQAKRPFTCSV